MNKVQCFIDEHRHLFDTHVRHDSIKAYQNSTCLILNVLFDCKVDFPPGKFKDVINDKYYPTKEGTRTVCYIGKVRLVFHGSVKGYRNSCKFRFQQVTYNATEKVINAPDLAYYEYTNKIYTPVNCTFAWELVVRMIYIHENNFLYNLKAHGYNFSKKTQPRIDIVAFQKLLETTKQEELLDMYKESGLLSYILGFTKVSKNLHLMIVDVIYNVEDVESLIAAMFICAALENQHSTKESLITANYLLVTFFNSKLRTGGYNLHKMQTYLEYGLLGAKYHRFSKFACHKINRKCRAYNIDPVYLKRFAICVKDAYLCTNTYIKFEDVYTKFPIASGLLQYIHSDQKVKNIVSKKLLHRQDSGDLHEHNKYKILYEEYTSDISTASTLSQ